MKVRKKDKYRSLQRELIEAQRNRKSEQLSKEQWALFEALWKADDEPEEEDAEPESDEPEEVLDDTPTRGRDGPAKFWNGYKGYLQADAYCVYDAFSNPRAG